MRLVTLFLDFDGVLTPLPRRVCGAFAWFACLPAFEAAVRPVRHNVEIILSSDWRLKHSVAELCARFSPDIAACIGGVIGPQRERRELEIIEWLAANPREHWLAVDDRVDQFTMHGHRLIDINRERGFTADDGQRLLDTVTELLQSVSDVVREKLR